MIALLLALAFQLPAPAKQALRCQVDSASDGYWYVHGYIPDKPKPELISMRRDRMKALKDCDKWLKEQEKPKKK